MSTRSLSGLNGILGLVLKRTKRRRGLKVEFWEEKRRENEEYLKRQKLSCWLCWFCRVWESRRREFHNVDVLRGFDVEMLDIRLYLKSEID